MFKEKYPYLITAKVINGVSVFMSMQIVQVLLNALQEMQAQKRIELYAYIIMENHLYIIASSDKLAQEIDKFKLVTTEGIVDFLKDIDAQTMLKQLQYYAHKYNNKGDEQYLIWQKGAYPQRIQNSEMMHQKIEDIHNIPLKTGQVTAPTQWSHSTAQNYAGQGGLLKVTTDWE